ncbi:MAG TPA: FecR domain-containing protein [Allosphingosinicella sp.]
MRNGSGSGDEVDARAAAWAVRSAERPLTPDEQQQLDHWLAADSRHLGAYVRAQALWMDSDRVASLDPDTRETVRHWRPFPWKMTGLAASFAALLIAGGIAYDELPGRIATGRAEVRQVALPDGSRATLDADSVLQIRYAAGARRIVLRGGAASFSVVHDRAHPFTVSAGGVDVTAVGTEFAVDLHDRQVAVTVAQGQVRVAQHGSSAPPRLVGADQQLVASDSGVRRADLDPNEVQRQLAWRQGLIVFDGQTLGHAASEVNRYAEVPITIDDPTLARAEFVGVFHLGDARSFAQAAARAFNGAVTQRADGLHLDRAHNSPSY